MSDYIPNGGPVGPARVTKPTASAKEISKWSMVVACLWIGLLTLAKALWGFVSSRPFGLEVNEIILSGLALAAVFSPVYFSIILDKIREMRLK